MNFHISQIIVTVNACVQLLIIPSRVCRAMMQCNMLEFIVCRLALSLLFVRCTEIWWKMRLCYMMTDNEKSTRKFTTNSHYDRRLHSVDYCRIVFPFPLVSSSHTIVNAEREHNEVSLMSCFMRCKRDSSQEKNVFLTA